MVLVLKRFRLTFLESVAAISLPSSIVFPFLDFVAISFRD